MKEMTFCGNQGVIILIIVHNNTFIHINIKVTLKEIFLNTIFIIMYVMFDLSKVTPRSPLHPQSITSICLQFYSSVP